MGAAATRGTGAFRLYRLMVNFSTNLVDYCYWINAEGASENDPRCALCMCVCMCGYAPVQYTCGCVRHEPSWCTDMHLLRTHSTAS